MTHHFYLNLACFIIIPNQLSPHLHPLLSPPSSCHPPTGSIPFCCQLTCLRGTTTTESCLQDSARPSFHFISLALRDTSQEHQLKHATFLVLLLQLPGRCTPPRCPGWSLRAGSTSTCKRARPCCEHGWAQGTRARERGTGREGRR